MKTKFDLSAAIRMGMAKYRVTQVEVANAVNLSTQTMNYIFQGHRTTRFGNIEKLAEYFGVRLSEFVRWGEVPHPDEFKLKIQQDGVQDGQIIFEAEDNDAGEGEPGTEREISETGAKRQSSEADA